MKKKQNLMVIWWMTILSFIKHSGKKYIYVIVQSRKKYGKYFSSFSNFLWNIFPEALAEGNIQRKLEKRENMPYFFRDWTITCLSSMYKIYETKTFNSRSQRWRQQKGAPKLRWWGSRENQSDFELTANQIARKICRLHICKICRVH